MNRGRLLPALGPAGAVLLVAGALAQPPGAGAPAGAVPVAADPLPVVPKSAGAFVTLKVSDLVAHPDLKPVLAQLAKQPDALAGITEAVGVSPFYVDRVTLFWPRALVGGADDPVLVLTTREPYNEARVLKALRARPVFDDDGGPGRGEYGADAPKAQIRFEPVGGAGGEVDPKGNFVPRKEAPPKARPMPLVPPAPKEDADDSCGGADGPSDPLYYELERGAFETLFLIDDRTLVFLPDRRRGGSADLALLAATLKKDARGPLAGAIAGAGKHTFAAGVNLTPIVQQLDRRRPPELVPYTALSAARTAVLTGDLVPGAKLTLTLTFDDAAAAKRAAPVLEEGIAVVAEQLVALADEMKDARRPFERSAAPLVGTFAGALKKASVKSADTAVTATADVDGGPAAAKALGDLLQAVQSRKRAEQRRDNLKQIGLALHNYESANGKFPTNVYGPKGEPLLSWRVHLLPYLEEDNLYKQFKMDEPWDGPNNKKLVEQMPKVFQAPDRDAPKGMTYYQGFIGPDPRKAPQPMGVFGRPWLLHGDATGLRITEITDGTSNTLAVVEAGHGVTWSKPDDLPFGGAVPALGAQGWDRTPALRFDGSVTLFPTDLGPERFWPHVTINGGEVLADLDERRPFGARREPAPVPPK
ncbi:MAG: DUF1559 domain-containing protein [Planctomycetes bacterium]|nr:DUF1559 domain-containing protein [Planctomycetota bacterium]